MGKPRGFTLVELMVVIMIIAITAGIAIPGMIAAMRASNERSASTSLKTICAAQADFRSNDRDGNQIQDFTTGNLSGLYGILPVGSTEMVKLIDISLAGADFEWHASAPSATLGDQGLAEIPPNEYSVVSPKASFWYKALTTDQDGAAYRFDTLGVNNTSGAVGTPNRNLTRFAYLAFPDAFSAGSHAFFVNESNTVFKRVTNGRVIPSGTPAGTTVVLTVGATGLLGTHPAETWPAEASLKAEYVKLD
jgi:prepilin-type N-terminal cleavage/methylation domain-containing protein